MERSSQVFVRVNTGAAQGEGGNGNLSTIPEKVIPVSNGARIGRGDLRNWLSLNNSPYIPWGVPLNYSLILKMFK